MNFARKKILATMLLCLFGQSVQALEANHFPYTPPSQSLALEIRNDAFRLIDNPPETLYRESDLACTAVAIYHEARGEPIVGQMAVASVILQRSLVPGRWGERPCDVVRPVMFSFMTSRYRYNPIREQKAWETAVRVAVTAFLQGPMPELKGADHYHTHEVNPSWNQKMPSVKIIGNHIFYVDPLSSPGRLVQNR